MGTQQPTQQEEVRAPDGRTPLWRAHIGLRWITFLWATVWFGISFHGYARPWLAAVVISIMFGWTVFTSWRYWVRQGRTLWLVLTDQVLVSALLLSNGFILSHQQMASGLPSVVTTWHASMVTAAAVYWGVSGGAISGVVAGVSSHLIRGYTDSSIYSDYLLLIGTGIAVGFASTIARMSTARLTQALRAEAATAERERLARSIHDNVLQVLARVRRRGADLGGEAAELAQLAGEQEIALRALVAAPATSSDDDEIDLGARLKLLSAARVQVSVPATAVLLPVAAADELLSLTSEALSNVERHAGPDARAWVLLEDLGSQVVLSVRDDGPGIPEGRITEAEQEGRLGIAQSIRGRATAVGGTISLETAPGEGTEWEVRVPRHTPTQRGEAKQGRLRQVRSEQHRTTR